MKIDKNHFSIDVELTEKQKKTISDTYTMDNPDYVDTMAISHTTQ